VRNRTLSFTKSVALLSLVCVSPIFAATNTDIASGLQRILDDGPAPLLDEAVILSSIPIDSISLERTPCFGSCPDYTVKFTKTGSAEMQGGTYAARKGKWHSKIAVRDFVRLCQLVYAAKFFNLKNEYLASWTDDTETIVTVTAGSVKKRISDYGNVGPVQVWGIAQAIDSISADLEWEHVQSSQPVKKTK